VQTDTGQDEPGQVPEKKRAAGASPALYSSERVDRNAVLLAVLQVDELAVEMVLPSRPMMPAIGVRVFVPFSVKTV